MIKKIIISLIIGALAGIIDVIPGIIKKVDWHITLAGFTFWLTLGFVIAHVSLPLDNWLKGLLIASILAIPAIILMSATNPKTVVPMIILSIVLGSLVGFLTGKYAI